MTFSNGMIQSRNERRVLPISMRQVLYALVASLLLHWDESWSAHAATDVPAYSDGIDMEAFDEFDWDTENALLLSSSSSLRKRSRDLTVLKWLNFYLGAEHSLRHDGLRRWFMEYQPANMPTDGSAPLLITLHWGLGNMRSSDYVGRVRDKNPWLKLAWQHGFLVLSPSATSARKYFPFLGVKTRGLNQDWNDLLGGIPSTVDDVGFIAALIDWAVAERNIDRSRVYVTGISNGGTMSQRLLVERPELFAGATTFNANLPERDLPLPSVGTPIFLMNGTNDTFIPYNGGASIKNRGAVRSAEATRDYFVAGNQAGPMVETLLPDVDPTDECRITSQYFPHTTTPVQFYRLAGGGHQPATSQSLPLFEDLILENLVGNTCHDIDSFVLAWAFMSQYSRQ